MFEFNNSQGARSQSLTEGKEHYGCVQLVGAGPGDPQLITVRGWDCLRRADVVLYDYLVNPVLASWVLPPAEAICLGKHGGSRVWSQDEINEAMLGYAREGKRVARLKGGDPAIFARGAEEVEFLERHGIPYEVVPGVTAALAAGSYAGIPLTHRDFASAVAFVTGHADPDHPQSKLDYVALARFPGTLVIYMGVTTAQLWVAKLIEHGLAEQTPAALVRRCSLPDQQVIRCTLSEIPRHVTPYQKFPPPVIAVIGPAVAATVMPRPTWQRPLVGQTVMITRAPHQAQDTARRLVDLGAQCVFQPAIAIGPPGDITDLKAALGRLGDFDWIVFSSVNGVEYFLDHLWRQGLDLRDLARSRIAAIGPATANRLSDFRLRVDVQPEIFRAEALAEELVRVAPQGRYLIIRASRGREILAETLTANGAEVTQVVAYESQDVTAPQPHIIDAIHKHAIQWTLVSSSAIARALHQMFGDDLRKTRLVSISPVTSGVIRDLGLEVHAEATTHTIDGLIAAIVDQVRQGGSDGPDHTA